MTYANIADTDQIEGVVWAGSTLFAIPLSILRNNCIKKIVLNKVFKILGHLPYNIFPGFQLSHIHK